MKTISGGGMMSLRKPKVKSGELHFYYGKSHDDCPDFLTEFVGDPTMKQDSKFLLSTFCSKKPDPFVQPIFRKMLPSFVEELSLRGYDITTIRFSIKKFPKEGECDEI